MHTSKILLLGLVVFSVVVQGCAALSPKPAEADRKVVLLSIDGLRPEFYQSAEYDAPNLKRLAATGIQSDSLTPVFPSLTYPVHATFVTGVSTARHGIYANRQLGPSGLGEWYFDASAFKVPALWDKAHAAGRTVAIVHWPSTRGAAADWYLPEIFASHFNFAEDWEAMVKNTKKDLLDEILSAYPHPGYSSLAQLDELTVNAAMTIIKNHQPDLTLVHLINLDFIQHNTGRSSPQTKAALKAVDALVGTLFASLDLSKTTVFVVGDHGFSDFTKTVNVNVMFERRGWRKNMDAYALSEGGQAAIYVKNTPKLEKKVLKVLRGNQRDRYEIITREHLDALGAYPGALCALLAQPGFAFGEADDAESVTVVEPHTKGAHGYLPTNPEMHSGFIAFGGGIESPSRLKNVNATSIAPMVTRILGLDRPSK